MRAIALQSTHRSASKLTELTTNEVSGLAGAVHIVVDHGNVVMFCGPINSTI